MLTPKDRTALRTAVAKAISLEMHGNQAEAEKWALKTITLLRQHFHCEDK